MKRFSLALAILLIFSFGLAYAQTQITLEGTPSVYKGQEARFLFRLTFMTGNGDVITGQTNGFLVYTSPVDGNFTPITWDTVSQGWPDRFDLIWAVNEFPPNTVGFGGANLAGPGIADGFNDTVWAVKTTPTTYGDTLCIDSLTYPPSNNWLWSTNGPLGNFPPAWSGPYCFFVDSITNFPAVFDNCVPSLTFDHCALATYDFEAHDQDTLGGQTIFALISGPVTTFNTATGVWTYQPTIADVGTSQSIVVEVCDGFTPPGCDTCTVNLNFTNVGKPTIICPPDTVDITILVTTSNTGTGTQQVTGLSNDCDPISYYISGVTPTPNGTYPIDGNGLLTFNALLPDTGLFTFTVCVTDGVDTACCSTYFNVVHISKQKWDIVIENTENTVQGRHEFVTVTAEKGSERMGGFDFLIAYDASALNFQMADQYDPDLTDGLLYLYDECGWEYFTYRYGPFGNCGNACPSGLLRVVGMAEINNGPHHPTCFRVVPPPYALFYLDFLVSNDFTLECNYVPIRFFWMDCGDNTISSKDGDTLWVSRNVFDKGGGPQSGGPLFPPTEVDTFSFGIYTYYEITDMYADFPTYTGVQLDPCIDSSLGYNWVWNPITHDSEKVWKVPQQFINFYNGGIDIVCVAELDDRGDINLNGNKNEIADAVMFTNYFIYGLGIFHLNQPAQIAATDVNADGLALSVADLVYQIRVIIGDALPYPKLAPVAANYTVDHGIISVDAEMGAAYVVVEGDATPSLLADQMDIKYNYDAEQNVTRVLVYSLKGNGFSGEFLNANGTVVSLELGSYEGAVVKATNIPADFALNQNYPNPFNPTTTISFNLPIASDYTLTMYNVTGQQVAEFTGTHEAGTVSIEWNASDMASGVYFYKLNAEDFSATKKMVLLK